MRFPKRILAAAIVVMLSSVVFAAAGAHLPAAAQSTYNAGLSVTVRADPGDAGPGQPVLFAVAVTNESAWTIHLDLVCDPPFDIQVRDMAGAIVWQKNPTCTPGTARIQLAPGQRKEWTARWSLVDSAGRPVKRAGYTVWGTVATTPLTSVAGPLIIEAGPGGEEPHPTELHEPTSTPREHPEPSRTPGDHPDPTRTPGDHPEPSRTPGDHPEPTRTPGDHPEPTRTPGDHPEPTERPEPTGVPTRHPEEHPAFPVTDREGRQRMPDVAGDPSKEDCQNLAVWWDETAKQIWGQIVEPDWRGDAFLISGELRADGPPSVTYSRELRRWFVVWHANSDAKGGEIYGRYVECAGLEGAPFGIGSNPSNDDQPVALSFGESVGVVWRRSGDDMGSKIFGAQIVGTDVRHIVQISGDGHASEPAAACEAGEPCLVVWTRAVGDSLDVVGRYWFPHEEYTGHKLLDIAVTEHRQRYPAVAWNGEVDSYLVTWTDAGGSHSSVRARAVYPTAPRGLDDYEVAAHTVWVSDDGRTADHGDVAAIGRSFVVVWSEGAGELHDIAARRVSVPRESHTPTVHAKVMVSTKDPVERYPAVASATDPLALAVWEIEWPNSSIDILGRHFVVPMSGGGDLVALHGVVTGGVSAGALLALPASARGGGYWDMRVDEVLAGSFDCEATRVYYDDFKPVAPPENVGDEVTVSGHTLPAPYGCALVAEMTDVGGGRVSIARLFLPMGAR